MIVKTPRKPLSSPAPAKGKVKILIVEARFYEDVADELLLGAVAEIEAQGARYDRVAVPGALEIPFVLAEAVAAAVVPQGATHWRWSGIVALGCVIRGETMHYEIVCHHATHWMMDVALRHNVPVGNGILTVETKEQALERARGGRNGKGGEAARACLKILETCRIFQDAGS
jgi:6,7-dimethyl-8-ribityllumazine synthase